MVFSSLTFLFLFLPILYFFIFISPDNKWRNIVLTVFSLLFYAWGEPVWILAMLLSTAVNYFCAKLIDGTENRHLRRFYLFIGVVASIAFLVYFKYSAFFVNSFAPLFGSSVHMEAPELPIGISFYTFQILTYTVDVYRGDADVQESPLKLLLYISCFPQLIAGPIVQYRDVAAQLDNREVSTKAFALGMARFIKGLGKKVIFANICGSILEELPLAGTGSDMSFAGTWLAALMYSLQLYFDFSAYSDMAIGLGRSLGFRYKENFNFPYISRSITEFWRRWHMSLGAFFRDYVYIPLGGNRHGVLRTILNMLIVWSLTGLWHGASWNFVMWGAYYGILLILERFVFKKLLEVTPGFVKWLITFLIVLVGWTIFYYTDSASLTQALRALFGIGVVGFIDPVTVSVLKKYTVFPILAFIFATPLIPKIADAMPKWLRDFLQPLVTIAIFLYSVAFLIGDSYNPFIYFRF